MYNALHVLQGLIRNITSDFEKIFVNSFKGHYTFCNKSVSHYICNEKYSRDNVTEAPFVNLTASHFTEGSKTDYTNDANRAGQYGKCHTL